MPNDFEIVDVVSSKEDWSLYKLEDGTIVKIRYILIKAVRHPERDQFGNPIYDLNSQNVIGIVPSKSSMGIPSPPFAQQELSSSVTQYDMEYDTIREPWNEYELKDGTVIRVKLVLTTLSRTSKFEVHGEPVYLVNTQPIIKGSPPEKLRKK